MSYRNFLGEFIVSSGDDWPKTIRYIERKPIQTRGAMNPWELERTRRVWVQEQAAWEKIKPLQVEYRTIEKQMESDISIFNAHLAELERVTKKKVGLGPIGTYGGMALAILPGFGWASAVFSAVSMLFQFIGGNKLKKRVDQLMKIMEEAQARLQKNKQRLITIQEDLKYLTESTERVRAVNESIRQQDIQNQAILQQAKESRETVAALSRREELSRIRQASPYRIQYAQDL